MRGELFGNLLRCFPSHAALVEEKAAVGVGIRVGPVHVDCVKLGQFETVPLRRGKLGVKGLEVVVIWVTRCGTDGTKGSL